MAEASGVQEQGEGAGKAPPKGHHPASVPTRFAKGVDPRTGIRAGTLVGEAAALANGTAASGAGGRLAVMQKVLGQRKCDDRGSTERVLRDWLEKDARGYLRELTAMEERLAAKSGGAGEVQEADEGRERAEAACERLLEAWKKGERS